MDYDLSRLSSREFEHLVQSLAAQAVFPGVVVFGDGPDDGREATFDGSLSYPTPENGWDGYVVLQAKFRQRPHNDGRDGAWFLEMLERELNGYESDDRRSPDYLILATNVVLTPPRDGAKDRVAKRLERARDELGLRGWDVWDYDKLRVLLDNNEPVRRSRAAWITPGDVLQDVISRMQVEHTSFESAIATFLQKELISDQYVNLEQAGHAAEDKIPLGRVFTDLPVGPDPTSPLHPRGLTQPTDCLEFLIDLAGQTLKPSMTEEITARGPDVGMERGRVVLVGGPGQGKSTLGQFLCQLHRAALLAERDRRTIAPEARQALDAVRACAEREQLKLPVARRFPVRVELNAYAAALAAEDGPGGLLDYLVQRVNDRTPHAVTNVIFRRWLEEYPWLIVLDGLDEVPASSNRDAVLASIADFWVDAAVAESDVFVVATTRPQGYNNDFSPGLYQHLRLESLDAPQALRYGNRLAEQRYLGDDDRIEKVKARLERAAANEATRWLMQSPLQVTIMTALVDRMGHPPQERWSLFNEYYNVIYQREMERDTPAATILREYRADVDAIHQRAALLLQIKSERAQQTEARLSHDQLAGIITQRLEDEGHEADVVAELREQILEAAGLRLVFLVGLQHDRIGFEIRSLQEYMAAECLVDGPDVEVTERLTSVAGITSWRNVFLFAVGHCFAVRQHLRDTVFRICTELNTAPEDPLARLGCAGSSLGIDLLLDGPARRQPRYAPLIGGEVARAFRGMLRSSLSRLPDTWTPTLDEVYHDALRETLGGCDAIEAMEGWRVLLALEARSVPWAEDLARTCWPDDPVAHAALLRCVAGFELGDASLRRLISAAGRLPLHMLKDLEGIDVLGEVAETDATLPAWFDHLSFNHDPFAGRLEVVVCATNLRNDWTVGVVPLQPRLAAPVEIGDLDRTWTPLVAAGQFAREPSAQRLAHALRAVADSCEPVEWRSALNKAMPWPMGSCLAYAGSKQQLRELSEAARTGRLGDRDEWMQGEKRWASQGVAESDLRATASLPDLPFDSQVGICGFPLWFHTWTTNSSLDLPYVVELMRELHATSPSSSNRALVAATLLVLTQPAHVVLTKDDSWHASRGEIAAWLEELQPGARAWISVDWLARHDDPDVAAPEALDVIGRRARLTSEEPGRHVRLEGFAQRLGELARLRPELPGLWTLLAHTTSLTREHVAAALAATLPCETWPQDVAGRAAAAVVRMWGQVAPADAEAIASAIAAAAADHGRQLSSLLPTRTSGAGHERILALLDERLPRDAIDLRLALAALEDDALRRRTSSLFDRDVWDALGLFTRDEQVLAPSSTS